MDSQERLRHAIDHEHHRLRGSVPPDRAAVILALLRARDRLAPRPDFEPQPDLITGRRLDDAGGNLALRLCLEATGDDARGVPTVPGGGWDDWAERFVRQCAAVATADLVRSHGETGFMRLVDDGAGTFDAWIATKQVPASWRERADIDWWVSLLARQYRSEVVAKSSAGQVLTPLPPPRGYPAPIAMGEGDAAQRVSTSDRAHVVAGGGAHGEHMDCGRLADTYLKMMSYQLGYPPDATIDGCTVRTYSDVLRQLIAWALQARDRGEAATLHSERDLVAALVAALGIDPSLVNRAVTAFTLDRENAAWHAAVPGVAAAPLVRVAPDRLVWSLYGLTTEPFFFLTRELRRRNAEAYHNSAYLREDVFRQELYALFADKRFVTSTGRITLRRAGGDVRTDIDAAIFDRKTGTLGLFELKSPDPFARSPAELARQRDNVLYANRQISGVLSWLNTHGGDEILNRVDTQTAKRFRVQKVYPFVLGRYLVHFNDGPAPDPRAAWGTWPQLLRLHKGQPSGSTANPIASLFARLKKDIPLAYPTAAERREIALGAAKLTVHPSFAAFQASAGNR
jgi:hypothetical protein